MNRQTAQRFNQLIHASYACFSFAEWQKIIVSLLHQVIPYDSGLFFSKAGFDCTFFKPFSGSAIEDCYQQHPVIESDSFHNQEKGKEADIHTISDFAHGSFNIPEEPHHRLLSSGEFCHIACIPIFYQGQCTGKIYLQRKKGEADFNEEEIFLLELLQPHIATVFHIIHMMEAVKTIESNPNHPAKIGLAVLDNDLRLIGGNAAGLEMMKLSSVFGSSILYHVKEWCKTMSRDGAAPIVLHSETLKTSTAPLEIEIYRKTSPLGKANFTITLQYADEDYYPANSRYKFTKREADIIDEIILGKNNTQIANTLHLSENTVKTHIQKIYRKVGVNNRTELTYILMTNGR